MPTVVTNVLTALAIVLFFSPLWATYLSMSYSSKPKQK